MKYFLTKKEDEIKEKIKNNDLFITDLDGTIADIDISKAFKELYNLSKQSIKELFNKDYKTSIVHRIYPSFKEFIDLIKCEKIIITRNIPPFVKPLADLLKFNHIHFGSDIPDYVLSGRYKRIVFAGNSAKDELIYQKIKQKENREIDYSIGIWVTDSKINENFDINLLSRNWNGLVSLLSNS